MPWLKSTMICSRQHSLKPVLRICAALLLLVWLGATGFCSTERLFGHAESGDEHDSDQTAHHQQDATSAPVDSDHSHDSDKHDGDGHSCCTSLKAIPQFVKSALLTKPDFGKPLSLSFHWLAQALTPVQQQAPSPRQARPREWVFTPEVCLGPAFRSHAPPLAI